MNTVISAAPPQASPKDFLTLDELGPGGLRSLLDLTGRLKRIRTRSGTAWPAGGSGCSSTSPRPGPG